MAEAVRLIPARRLAELETSLRRLRWGCGAMACLVVALLFTAAGYQRALLLPEPASLAEAGTREAVRGQLALARAVHDPLYDQFLQEFYRLRNRPEARRYLAAQVLGAAAIHQVDADLLFALVAVESSFDSQAVSPKGARGLGQMVFATARSVAPGAVRTPADLHDAPRNLFATALHLRRLLDEGRGDVRWALRTYYTGAGHRHLRGGEGDQYVARVATHYAYLKARRAHDHLGARAGGGPAPRGARR